MQTMRNANNVQAKLEFYFWAWPSYPNRIGFKDVFKF